MTPPTKENASPTMSEAGRELDHEAIDERENRNIEILFPGLNDFSLSSFKPRPTTIKSDDSLLLYSINNQKSSKAKPIEAVKIEKPLRVQN